MSDLKAFSTYYEPRRYRHACKSRDHVVDAIDGLLRDFCGLGIEISERESIFSGERMVTVRIIEMGDGE